MRLSWSSASDAMAKAATDTGRVFSYWAAALNGGGEAFLLLLCGGEGKGKGKGERGRGRRQLKNQEKGEKWTMPAKPRGEGAELVSWVWANFCRKSASSGARDPGASETVGYVRVATPQPEIFPLLASARAGATSLSVSFASPLRLRLRRRLPKKSRVATRGKTTERSSSCHLKRS